MCARQTHHYNTFLVFTQSLAARWAPVTGWTLLDTVTVQPEETELNVSEKKSKCLFLKNAILWWHMSLTAAPGRQEQADL